MIVFNSYTKELTGTDYGYLSAYPKSSYLDAYLLTDLFGNTEIGYNAEVNSNSFYSNTSYTSLTGISGIIMWLDSQDVNLTHVTSPIISLCDKHSHIPYEPNNSIYLNSWPITGTGFNSLSCIEMTKDLVLSADISFYNLTSFSLFFVWKENNTSGGISIPFFAHSIFDSLCSEMIIKNQNLEGFQGQIGVRDTYGYNVASYNGTLSSANILEWDSNDLFGALSSQDLKVNLNSLVLSSYQIDSRLDYLSSTGIGYVGDGSDNSFLFGELIFFDRVLESHEKIKVYNYFSNKWNLPYYSEDLTFSYEITGGPFSLYSYEDFSSLTSIITLPIQSCITMVTVSLTSFDVSRSKVSKIVYSYDNTEYTITSRLSSGKATLAEDSFSVIVVPNNKDLVSTYYLYMSVIRQDSTLNKFVLSGNILKCGIRDFYENTKLLDSQVADNSEEIILVAENADKLSLFLNKINVDMPSQILSGGDINPLVNSDLSLYEEDVLQLSELLDIEATSNQQYNKPYYIPVPAAKINPIRPE